MSSLRFENVRDGIEDFELLQMLSLRKGDAGAAGRRLCDRLMRSLTDFSADPGEFMEARRQLLEELDRLAVEGGSGFESEAGSPQRRLPACVREPILNRGAATGGFAAHTKGERPCTE